MGPYDHHNGTGFVAAHGGDYRDAIRNRKAKVHLIVHETFGGFSRYGARHLRRLGRDAAVNGCDATDYTRSYTANSFVSYYSQYISSVCVMGSSAGILAGLARAKGSVLKNNRALAAAAP